MKNVLLVGIITLLFSSCGQLENAPTPTNRPEIVVTSTEIATNTPVLIATSTVIVAKGLVPEKFSKYIGLNYPPLPDGISQNFGLVIWNSNDYGLSLVSDGENKMLWLNKLTRHDSSGKAYWEVKDILELPNIESDVVLIPDGCLLNGEFDYEILVIGKWDDEVFVSRYMTNDKILLAWRANTILNVFEVISTNGIECHADNATNLK